MTSTSPTRSRYSVPRPETGLAEWASRIKAIQQQVDADEEAEQRKLEEEIAASRMARLRRSRGVGGQDSPTDSSFDMGEYILHRAIALYLNRWVFRIDRIKQDLPPSSRKDDEFSDLDRVRPTADRQRSQADALERLVGSGSSSTASMDTRSSASAPSATAKRAEPMSLAAFMGGRATGPRLNRHAPQQDAHDPTQFEQRTRIDAPHPVFGRGGVAMPGMAKKTSSPSLHQTPEPADPPVQRTRRQSSPSKVELPSFTQPLNVSRDRTVSTSTTNTYSSSATSGVARSSASSVVSRYTESLQDRPRSSQSSHRHRSKSRDRVTSPSTVSNRAASDVGSSHRSVSRERRSATPSGDSISARRASVSPRPVTPTSSQRNSSPSRSSPPISTHTLARPVQPAPTPTGPQMPSNEKTAPAFLKPPPQKEPTPSLSRLKGRGFVQNMVRASQQLEPIPPVPVMTDKTGTKRSVLDRWPGASKSPTTASPPPKPPVAQKPTPPRKAVTVDENPTIIEPKPKPQKLRSVKSMSSTIPAQFTGKSSSSNVSSNISSIHPQSTGGLGSATTLMIMKPATTGGEPAMVPAEVDELGMKSRGGTSFQGDSPGKPLIHVRSFW
jgi:hypothetical protein